MRPGYTTDPAVAQLCSAVGAEEGGSVIGGRRAVRFYRDARLDGCRWLLTKEDATVELLGQSVAAVGAVTSLGFCAVIRLFCFSRFLLRRRGEWSAVVKPVSRSFVVARLDPVSVSRVFSIDEPCGGAGATSSTKFIWARALGGKL